jgi:GDP-L-fucose synthase
MTLFDRSRILITGSHGFLGHHVVNAFEDYSMHPERSITLLTPTSRELNLLNKEAVQRYLANNAPDIIIHLAAQCGGIGINSQKPGEFLLNNMMMTTNLIDATHLYDNSIKFVGVGTVCSYPKHTPVPFKEDDLYNGYPEETNAPYGLAKRMQLEMLRAYRKQYGFNGIFLIPVNMMGEYDNFDENSSHVIPAMLKKFHHAKVNNLPTVTLWGDGSPSREFLYAGDCAEAILRATILYDGPDPVNIGTGKEIKIKQLAEKIKTVVDYKGQIVWDTTKPNGQPRRCLDTTRAKQMFGFEAKSDFDKVLRNTYFWAINNNVL